MTTAYINKREIARTLNQYTNQKALLVNKLKEFVNHKMQYPSNGGVSNDMPGFGSSDKKFRTDGNYGKAIRNVSHAHLTSDISVAYLVDGDRLNIYGVYTHDDLGTGQPANVKRQKQMATRWGNLSFDSEFSVDSPADEPADKEVVKAPAGPKPDFTPKVKPSPPPADDPKLALIKKVNAHWPDRGLLNKLSNFQNTQAALAVINQEAQHIIGLQKRGTKLSSSQVNYFQGLSDLFDLYSKR